MSLFDIQDENKSLCAGGKSKVPRSEGLEKQRDKKNLAVLKKKWTHPEHSTS